MVEVNRWVSQIHRLKATNREKQHHSGFTAVKRAGGGVKKPKRRVEKRHAELGTADDASQNLRVWKSNLEIHKHQLSVILGRGITRKGGFL